MTLLSVKYFIPFSLSFFFIRVIRTDLILGFFLRKYKPCSFNRDRRSFLVLPICLLYISSQAVISAMLSSDVKCFTVNSL